MTITSTPHSFLQALQSLKGSRPRRSAGHPEALPALQYIVPERITDPATAEGAALALCRNRWDELTVVLYLDNQHSPEVRAPTAIVLDILRELEPALHDSHLACCRHALRPPSHPKCQLTDE